MKIGGTARYFCPVEKAEELTEVLAFAREKKIECAVLGGGSNTLIADADIDALIIKIDIKGIDWNARGTDAEEERGTHTELLVVGAGENWDGLVAKAVKRGLWGIENLSGIPGTVGAAPIQNIGAYGMEIKETLAWVEVFDTKTGKSRELSTKECEFGYRDSVFKHPKGKSLIVTRVALRLKRNGIPDLEYRDLQERFKIYDVRLKKEKPTLREIRKAILEIRSRKFPDLRECGTAGSFFKNPVISRRKFNELKKRHPALPGFELKIKDKGLRIKMSLAWVLDNICDLKGYAKGNVRLFEHQPIVLVQNGSASCTEVEAFAKEIAERVKKKTGIEIEWEVQRIR